MQARNILISGGSRGLGLSIVRHMLEKGHTVVSFARKSTENIEVIKRKYPQSFFFDECDSRDDDKLRFTVKYHEKKRGPFFGLINNAAVGQDNLLAHIKPSDIHELLAINLEAPILLSRLIVRSMLMNNTPGRIVNISSICGMRGYQGLTVYSATKGAMDAFTRSLARELGARGILINSIAPGFFESEMSSVLAPAQLEVIKRRTVTGTMTTESQVMPVLDMLMFEDCNITGQTIVVDGGSTI